MLQRPQEQSKRQPAIKARIGVPQQVHSADAAATVRRAPGSLHQRSAHHRLRRCPRTSSHGRCSQHSDVLCNVSSNFGDT